MDTQTRELATFVALLSVAVIGVAVGFLRPTISRLQSRYQVLLSDEKSATTKMVMWMSALLLLISLLTVILGSISSDLLSWDLFRLVTLPILFVWGVLFVMTSRKRKDGESWTRKVDGQGFFHLLSLVFLILGITFDLFGLFGVSATALDFHIGPFQDSDFRMGTLSLYWGITFFCLSVGILAWAIAWPALDQVVGRIKKDRQAKKKDSSHRDPSDQE